MTLRDFLPPVFFQAIRRLKSQIKKRRYAITTTDYNAQKYWDERHKKFGYNTLIGVGNQDLSEDENYAQYNMAKYIFLGMVYELNIDPHHGKVLELGYGNGFYSKIVERLGFSNYLGVDICDIHVNQLEKDIPKFAGKFRKADIGIEQVDFKFCDLIIMIDVSQHIVNDQKVKFCLIENVKANLKEDGVFIVTDALENKKYHFYEVSRNIRFYQDILGLSLFHKPIPFRDKFIFSFKGSK